MTSADIVLELRSARPTAPASLRGQVASIPERRPVQGRRRLGRLAGRGLLVAVPVATALAVAVGLATSRSPGVVATTRGASPPLVADDAASAEHLGALPQRSLGAPVAKVGSGGVDRAQSFAATLTLRTKDSDALAAAAQQAIAVADELGGFVVASQVTTGPSGYASITMKVPFAKARDAVARLSRLGKIEAQDVRIQDLQESLDGLDRQIRITRSQLATVLAKLEGNDLDTVERARLEARRDALREQLAGARSARASTDAQAQLATIQLELRLPPQESVVPVAPSRFDRALDRALDVLAWEAVALLVLAIVLTPLALAAFATTTARRAARRRLEDRLLS